MTDILHLLFSAYIVFTIFDINNASHQYDTHKFMSFDKPTKSWFSFFIKDQAWSIGTVSVVALLTWMFI